MNSVAGKALTRAVVWAPVALCGCSSLFDGFFPTDAGALPVVSAADEASDSAAGSDAQVDAQVLDSASETTTEGGSCIPVTSGLIGHWTMDLASIDGTVLTDISGNHSDGTLVGFSQPDTAPGRFGEALVYPSVGMAHVHIGVLPLDQSPMASNTVSMWFNRASGAIDDVLAMLPSSPRYDLWLTGTAGNDLCINTGHGECFGVEDQNLTGRWVHVVAVFANGPIGEDTLYIDGQNRNAACLEDAGYSSCDQMGAAAAPVDFGGETDFFFHGMLDEVRIYSRALDAAEVTALYTGTACP
jgi:hypothetical protein